jgi:hypothetical protein
MHSLYRQVNGEKKSTTFDENPGEETIACHYTGLPLTARRRARFCANKRDSQ